MMVNFFFPLLDGNFNVKFGLHSADGSLGERLLL